MNRLARLFAAIALAAPPLAAQSDAPRMSDVMSQSEMRETGMAALTPAQHAAMDQWLARYTAIIERAASHGAQNAGGGGSSGAQNETYAGPTAVPYGTRIAAVLEGGTRIALTDGTVWEVNLPDRPSTTRWAKGDYVIVASLAIEINNTFFFQLINGHDGTSAAVAWRGKE